MAWVIALLAILVGPIVWTLFRNRSGGAPRYEDEPNATGVTGVVRNIESGGRLPGGPMTPPTL